MVDLVKMSQTRPCAIIPSPDDVIDYVRCECIKNLFSGPNICHKLVETRQHL